MADVYGLLLEPILDGTAMEKLKDGFKMAFSAALATPALAMGALVGLKEFGDSISSFVGKMNPASVKEWNRVFDDMQATIGAQLSPVLVSLTNLFRVFADFIYSSLPNIKEMNAVMASMDPTIKSLRSSLAELAPVMKDFLTNFLRGMLVIFKFLSDVMVNFMIGIHQLTGGRFGLNPDPSKRNQALQSSYGMSGEGAATKSIGDLTSDMINQAFGGAGFAQQQLDEAKVANRILDSINQRLGGSPNDPNFSGNERNLAGARLGGGGGGDF